MLKIGPIFVVSVLEKNFFPFIHGRMKFPDAGLTLPPEIMLWTNLHLHYTWGPFHTSCSFSGQTGFINLCLPNSQKTGVFFFLLIPTNQFSIILNTQNPSLEEAGPAFFKTWIPFINGFFEPSSIAFKSFT